MVVCFFGRAHVGVHVVEVLALIRWQLVDREFHSLVPRGAVVHAGLPWMQDCNHTFVLWIPGLHIQEQEFFSFKKFANRLRERRFFQNRLTWFAHSVSRVL